MRAFLFLLPLGTLAWAQATLPPPANIKVDFERHVLPILSQRCFSCHGEEAQQAGLRLDFRQNALRGGDYGPVMIAGKSAESKLIRRLVGGDGGLQMPPSGPLDPAEIGVIRAWIDQGIDYRMEIQEPPPPPPLDPRTAALISAIRSQSSKDVEKMLAADPSLAKAKDRAGSTPLHHAAGFGTLASMELLLRHGADPNAPNKRKSTPLFWALHDEAKVRLLLGRGADVNARLSDGRTPAYQAAYMATGLPLLRLLLEKGAKPDAPTISGQTPLMAAAERGNIETIRFLLARGVQVNAQSSSGATALTNAAATGLPQAVHLLLEAGSNPNLATKKNQTALAFAATAGNEECVKLLLDRGAKVDVQDDRGYTALLYAAGSDTAPAGVVRLLLAKGSRPDLQADGETAPQLAAKRGRTEAARLLGASVAQSAAPANTVTPVANRPLSAVVAPAFDLLEKQSHNFIRIGGCNSCHGQDLPSAAAAFVRDRGLPAPRSLSQLSYVMNEETPERIMDLNSFGVVSLAWQLFDLGMNRVPANEYTDSIVRLTLVSQNADGYWHANESRRPPMSAGPYQTAALAIYVLKTYGRSVDKPQIDRSLAQASAWLAKSAPANTNDRAFRLLGLTWAGSKPAVLGFAAKELINAQRDDGGWSQLPTLESDAYASGLSLYALQASGRVPVAHAAYRKGVQYLLHTQAPDGTWHVKSRAIWVQPYFESGFPYGTDQWISSAGTSWALMALAATAEPPRLMQTAAAK